MTERETTEVPRPDYSGFKEGDAQKYTAIYQRALKKFEKDGLVDYALMTTPAYPSNLSNDTYGNEFQIDSEAYKAFNLYVRIAFKHLFPTEYVRSFEQSPKLAWTIGICEFGLIDALKDKVSVQQNKSPQYSIYQKREYELQNQGGRYNLPVTFHESTLQKLREEDPLCIRFTKYMALLALAAYAYLEEYTASKRLPLDSLEVFLADMTPRSARNDASKALSQTVNNYSNFADLLGVILHVQGLHNGIGIPLRQYFTDSKGQEMVAKCGFLDAFQEHIADIVLAEDSFGSTD